jgi:hypothetical protein
MAQFFWNNTGYDNELWHVESKLIVAQVFKDEMVDGVQQWKLLLPWHADKLVFNKRTSAKAWALREAKDHAERYYTEDGWKPGHSPAEERVAARERKAKQEEHVAKAKASKARQEATS